MDQASAKAYGERQSSVQYFIDNRHSLAGLYPSERHFLQPALESCASVLDIGCAAGGGYHFSQEAHNGIRYTGIDTSDNLIQVAKSRLPEGDFQCFDGQSLPFADQAFELSFSLGVLHHLPHWQQMIMEMLRVSSRYAVFDLRLTDLPTLQDPEQHFQKIAFEEEWDGVTRIPYLVLNRQEVEDFAQSLVSAGYRVQAFGYAGKPTDLAVIPYDSVQMVSFCIERNSARPGVEFAIEA